MNREEELQWERQYARPVAIAAFVSAFLSLAAGVYLRSKVTGTVNDNVDRLVLFDKHSGPIALGSALGGISTLLLIPLLYYLFRATRFRREQLPRAVVYAVVAAPVLSGVFGLAYQLKANSLAHQYVAHTAILPPDAAVKAANHVLANGTLTAFGGLSTAGGLGMVLTFILISLNAMRAGLLSRFMGILGIIAGVLLILPLQGDLPVVQAFWVAAMGVLFLGTWPQGRGPAWDSGEAIPWPTAQDRRDATEGRATEPGTRGRGRLASSNGADADEPGDADEPLATTTVERPRATQHPRSKKRKRKRR